MKADYVKIKKYLQIVFFSIDLIIFFIVLFSTNSSNEKYKEYTGSSKFFLDLYIILIYGILIAVTLLPGLLYRRIKKYIVFIFTDKGKIIISYSISLIYWFSRNKPQLILGIILTITSTLLLIYEFIFYFNKVDDYLSSKGFEFSNKGKSTFDMNSLEKNENNIETPMSKGNPGYENSQSDGNNNSFEGNGSGNRSGNTNGDNNPQIPPQAQYQRDVEISTGNEANNPNQQGFGF